MVSTIAVTDTVLGMGQSSDPVSRRKNLRTDRHCGASETRTRRVSRPNSEGGWRCGRVRRVREGRVPPAGRAEFPATRPRGTRLGRACALVGVCPPASASVEPECGLQDNKGSPRTFSAAPQRAGPPRRLRIARREEGHTRAEPPPSSRLDACEMGHVDKIKPRRTPSALVPSAASRGHFTGTEEPLQPLHVFLKPPAPHGRSLSRGERRAASGSAGLQRAGRPSESWKGQRRPGSHRRVTRVGIPPGGRWMRRDKNVFPR